jgi:hypothetical protein
VFSVLLCARCVMDVRKRTCELLLRLLWLLWLLLLLL